MKWYSHYDSPLGGILLEADEKGLTGLCFSDREGSVSGRNQSVFEEALCWLGLYFSGKDPGFIPAIHLTGSVFQMEVWRILLDIPYGQTETYGGIAKRIAEARGIGRMSAQAVGGAARCNPIALIVPCHRVLGSRGELTGYAGGVERKRQLLVLEGIF